MACPKYSPIIDPRQLLRYFLTHDCRDSKVTHKESWIKGQKQLQSLIENSTGFPSMSPPHSLPLASSGNPQALNPQAFRTEVHSSHSSLRSMTEIYRLGPVNRRPLFCTPYTKSKNLTGSKQMNISFPVHSIKKKKIPFIWKGLIVTQEPTFWFYQQTTNRPDWVFPP